MMESGQSLRFAELKESGSCIKDRLIQSFVEGGYMSSDQPAGVSARMHRGNQSEVRGTRNSETRLIASIGNTATISMSSCATFRKTRNSARKADAPASLLSAQSLACSLYQRHNQCRIALPCDARDS